MSKSKLKSVEGLDAWIYAVNNIANNADYSLRLQCGKWVPVQSYGPTMNQALFYLLRAHISEEHGTYIQLGLNRKNNHDLYMKYNIHRPLIMSTP